MEVIDARNPMEAVAKALDKYTLSSGQLELDLAPRLILNQRGFVTTDMLEEDQERYHELISLDTKPTLKKLGYYL